ncbi:hypothetical protein B0H14DRAFT_3435969 [Mycena olivaceomarginata]|nr:hypothetical protein B0H14DRAFT_3435969 [Mycena olivaceomarginata]
MARPPGSAFLGASATEATATVNSMDTDPIKVIIDSGSDITLISRKTLEELTISPKLKAGHEVKLIQVTGKSSISGFVNLDLFFHTEDGPVKINVEAYVVNGISQPSPVTLLFLAFTDEPRDPVNRSTLSLCCLGMHGDELMTSEDVLKVKGLRENGSAEQSSRAVVAAEMQATYELMHTTGVTISADSTSNRGINIESAHMALRVPDYASGNFTISLDATPKVRFLGVDKTIDHSSAESVRGWSERIQGFCDLFNRSPLAKRLAQHYGIRDFLRILNGMNGDHAANEKSTARGLQELKHDASIEDLGEESLAGSPTWKAGGVEGWNALPAAEQVRRDEEMMKQIVTVLGKETYDTLSPEDRRRIDSLHLGRLLHAQGFEQLQGGQHRDDA